MSGDPGAGHDRTVTRIGADVEQLDAVAAALGQVAGTLRTTMTSTTALMSTTWWEGADAERTRDWWKQRATGQLRTIDATLTDLAEALRQQAEAQRVASDVAGPPRSAGFFDTAKEWVEGRVDDAGDWLDDRREDWDRFVEEVGDGARDVADGEEDDDGGRSRGFGIPGPLDDWARDAGETVVDRGSTLIDYGVRTADRRVEHPIQSLVDLATGTARAEDLAAFVQIAGNDAEIVDHPYGNDAVVLNHAWAPFEGGAITIGHTVSYNSDGSPSHDLVQHEMQHVYDIEDAGGLGFYGSYGLDWAWNYVVEGKRGEQEAYRDIFWEQRGYQAGDPGPHTEPEGILGGFWKKIW